MPLKSSYQSAAEMPRAFSPGLFKSRNNETIWLITYSAPASVLMPGAADRGYVGVLVGGVSFGNGFAIGHSQAAIDLKNFEPFYGTITLEQTR